MRLRTYDFDIDNADDNGLVTVGAIAGAGAITLNGALISGGTYTSVDGLGHRVDIISAGNDAGITFTIVGTDPDGAELTEVVTGANAGTATSTGYFKTISSITASGASAGNVTIGTTDEVSSQTIPVDWRSGSQVLIGVNVTGTINYTVNQANNAIQTETPNWLALSALSAKTADLHVNGTLGITALQFIVNSYSSGAEVQLSLSQSTDGF